MSIFLGTPLGDAWNFAFHRRRPKHHDSENVSLDALKDGTTVATSQVSCKDEILDRDPKKWPLSKKLRVVAIISFYTFAVYAGSAIYISSAEGVGHEYGSTAQVALLGLSLYVLGYGTGPLLWAPLSEVSWIGRNPVYWMTALVFLTVSIITATVRSFPFFLVLRFLQGFFGSPCLANGGASLHDIFEGPYLPLTLSVWVAFAYAGPAIGPVMASYLVEKSGWRISMWEIVACAAVAFVMLLMLPETYHPKILHQTGTWSSLVEHQELAQHTDCQTQESVSATIYTALTKPIQICLKDPAIAYVNVYTSYLYSCYYTFFDGFPMVYTYTYRFIPSHIGLVFLPIIVGCAIAAMVYFIYITRFAGPKQETNPEARLIPALLAVWLPPIGIFIFGWTAEHNAHWISGMIGLVVYAGGVFIILQCIIMYILDSYPKYAASLFAANDFCRSGLAAGAVHFGLPLYANLGPGKACSILGSVSVLGIAGMFILYWQGENLRARSKFTD